jgi:hypothetical protein
MKYLYSILAFFTLLSCSKEVDDTLYKAYSPAKIDVNGGTWKSFILASPTDVAISVPKLVTDAAYLKEIDSLKTIVIPGLTAAQKKAIE